MKNLPLIDQTALYLYAINGQFLMAMEKSYQEAIQSLSLLELHKQLSGVRNKALENPNCVMTRIMCRSLESEFSRRQVVLEKMKAEWNQVPGINK